MADKSLLLIEHPVCIQPLPVTSPKNIGIIQSFAY